MKKKLGASTYLYPMPTTIVGANVKGKPNFNAIAYMGVVCHQPPMVALGMNKGHLTMEGIEENKTFSINLPTEDQVVIADYVGMKSGRKIDKESLFTVSYGELTTAPMIEECPINLECEVKDILDYGGMNYTVIAEIKQVYAKESVLGDNGKPELAKLKPIVFSMHENNYYKVGELLAGAWKEGLKFEQK